MKVRKYLLNFYSKKSKKVLTITYDDRRERDIDVEIFQPLSVVDVELDYAFNEHGELVVISEEVNVYQIGAKYEKNYRRLQVVKPTGDTEKTE